MALDEPRTRDETEPRGRPHDRRWRLVAPAITPLRATDVLAGLAGQSSGGHREGFRNDICAFLDAESAATYTSFRRALGACLHELAASDDRNGVLVPAFCSSDYPEAIEGVGLDARRYDVDDRTLAIDLDSIEADAVEDAAVLVAVNVLGYGSPMEKVVAFCETHDLRLVEALGYALGTEYEGQRLGTFGDRAVLNFQQGKPIPVGGGMVVSQDELLAVTDEGRPAVGPNVGSLAGYGLLSHPRLFPLYRRVAAQLDRFGGGGRVTTHPESKTDIDYADPHATMSDFQGAIARRVFRRLGDHRHQRARTARFYGESLADCEHVDHLRPVPGISNLQHVRFPLLVDDEALRGRLKRALRDAGIETSRLYDWPVLEASEYPGAARLQRRILTLPTHPYVDERDRRLVVEVVREVVADFDRPG